jgi:hypothetical protein
MKGLILVACVISAAGCTSISDVVQVGQDTYTISSSSTNMRNSGSMQTNMLYKEAGTFCEKFGKKAMTVSHSSINGGFGVLPSAEIMFRCLLETDPEWGRPIMKTGFPL